MDKKILSDSEKFEQIYNKLKREIDTSELKELAENLEIDTKDIPPNRKDELIDRVIDYLKEHAQVAERVRVLTPRWLRNL